MRYNMDVINPEEFSRLNHRLQILDFVTYTKTSGVSFEEVQEKFADTDIRSKMFSSGSVRKSYLVIIACTDAQEMISLISACSVRYPGLISIHSIHGNNRIIIEYDFSKVYTSKWDKRVASKYQPLERNEYDFCEKSYIDQFIDDVERCIETHITASYTISVDESKHWLDTIIDDFTKDTPNYGLNLLQDVDKPDLSIIKQVDAMIKTVNNCTSPDISHENMLNHPKHREIRQMYPLAILFNITDDTTMHHFTSRAMYHNITAQRFDRVLYLYGKASNFMSFIQIMKLKNDMTKEFKGYVDTMDSILSEQYHI